MGEPTLSDLERELRKLRAMLTATQAQLSVCLEEAARVPVPARREHRCRVCGIQRATKDQLLDHLELVHDIVVEAAS